MSAGIKQGARTVEEQATRVRSVGQKAKGTTSGKGDAQGGKGAEGKDSRPAEGKGAGSYPRAEGWKNESASNVARTVTLHKNAGQEEEKV